MPKPSPQHIDRTARLRWVPIADMKVSPVAQRELNQARVDRLAADLDLEQLGYPTVNQRDGSYYVIDGQHRVEALRATGWGDQQIQCQTYDGLTEEEEAETFLRLNDALAVRSFDKFRIAVQAGREIETDVDRVVRAQGLSVSLDQGPGTIRAAGTLRKVYVRAGADALGRTLRIIRDAYGDAGFEAPIIRGIGLLCERYNGQLDETLAQDKLGSAHGGVAGLVNKAELLRRQTGNQKGHCIAAAAVEIINSGRKRGERLPDWFRAS